MAATGTVTKTYPSPFGHRTLASKTQNRYSPHQSYSPFYALSLLRYFFSTRWIWQPERPLTGLSGNEPTPITPFVRPKDHSLAPPVVRTRYTPRHHPLSDVVLPVLRDFFSERWPWPSEEARNKYRASDLELFNTLFMPDASNSRIELACKANSLGFLHDDYINSLDWEKAKKHAERVEGIIFGTISPETEIETIVDEVFSKIRATGRLGYEYCADWVRWFMNTTESSREGLLNGGLEEYVKYRSEDIGFLMAAASMRWSGLIDVPQHIRETPSLREMERLACEHILFANDLCSYRVEAADAEQSKTEVGSVIVNAVVVFMAENRCSEQIAIKALCKITEDLEEDFEAAAVKVEKEFSEASKLHREVRRYAVAMRGFVVGNLEWGMVCGRYNDMDGIPKPKGGKGNTAGDNI